ncbi:putative short chain dehydrogenase reductase family [Diaporthe ampelina]|uniref:Putative short chain dehydrogenase reductase family n=1 Tax=Diaporthe ampelina TaxID=1214573 RepID=A0A0G2HRK3_9PEZI|nr:putative short chain dehydrogenase reductase family [Diaporthe ampelina]
MTSIIITSAKDSAVGSSFDQHVVGGYRFLMRFYSPGDEIYIFGFSRGAYIARFLAEMLDYVGLLSHGNEEMVAFAWKAFSQWQCRRTAGEGDVEGLKKKAEMYQFMKGFRETFSRPVRRIRFLGLFDTVNSVPRFETAWMERSKFPYTARSSAKVIRHAVSIDERRAKFRQDLMYQSHVSNKKQSRHHGLQHDGKNQVIHGIHAKYHHRSKPSLSGKEGVAVEREERGRRSSYMGQLNVLRQDDLGQPTPYRKHSRSKSRATQGTADDGAPNMSQTGPGDDDEDFESEDETEQDIDEVWFAGGHGDVGGGWQVEPGTKSTSHVPLVWLVREAMKAGLQFDTEKVVAMGCADVLDCEPASKEQHTPVPDIRIDTSTPPDSPDANKEEFGLRSASNGNGHTATTQQPQQNSFHELMYKAHVAGTHDSLSHDCGMSYTSVLAWKMMEYMPFRRMDLQPDGTWKPIRWPLPAGEVRDIPDDAKVHGSVIRRMKTDKKYRPGNLIVGGGGRGCRVAPEEYGIGQWECIASPGCPVEEVWKKVSRTDSDAS